MTEPVAADAAGVTRQLAAWIVSVRHADVPEDVGHEAARTLLNYVAAAVGGSRHDAVEIAVAALRPLSGGPQATLLGRRERLDVCNAALVNGIASHVLDQDDTHLATVIHPAAPVASALLAASELRAVSGRDFLDALAVGIEAELRIGRCVYPDHYERGWHITGTAGPFGAAAAVGRIVGLTEQQMVWALGLAASQPVGFRESFGSMNKSFNPGRAASNGLLAAILASKGFRSSEAMIEAKRGWASTISTKQDLGAITNALGQRWEAALNTYKPFACGIVLHPAIDAALQLRREAHHVPGEIARIDAAVHPLVLELTGKATPRQGLEGKFSVHHAIAVAMVEGAAGDAQFTDRAVSDAAVVALRGKIRPVADASLRADEVDLTVILEDGRSLRKHVEHAIGSLGAPMTDEALEAKFMDLARGVLLSARARRVIALCWNAAALPDVAEIARAAALEDVTLGG